MGTEFFTQQFCLMIRSLVEKHHELYPMRPPQGVFFEDLVQQAFRQVGWSEFQVIPTAPNSPAHDLLIGNQRLSIKTETGKGTKAEKISITKLCTTEREPWNSPALVKHTMEHLSRYDRMLMLRAIWHEELIHYQLLEVPLSLLRQIAGLIAVPVGRRSGRQSLGGDVYARGQVAFHVHFDGADGKCQIRNLPVRLCRMLLEWDQPISV
jgi:hypothetical protein